MVSTLETNMYIILMSLLSIEDWYFAKSVAAAKAVTVLQKLGRACRPPTLYGLAALHALSNDKLPPRLDRWPCDD